MDQLNLILGMSGWTGKSSAIHNNGHFFLLCSNNISLSALAFGSKKDNPVYVSQESGVVGLNFHQSKEVLISDTNGSTYNVSFAATRM
jgi:hypothetical protein